MGGSEHYVRALLREFHAGNGPERVTLLANSRVARAYADQARDGVDVRRVRTYRAGDSSATRLLAMSYGALAPGVVARDLPPGLDVIHFPLTVPIPKTRTPTVVTLHDLQHLELPEMFSRGERRFRRWAYEGAARWATQVITPSEHARRELVERVGVDAERITAIPHGIDAARFAAGDPRRDAELLRDYELPERFLYYGANAWPHKNHARLIEALGRTTDRSIGLVLSGNAHGRAAELRALAGRFGVGDRVRHLGFLPTDAVAPLLRRARAMIFPSLYEGFGFPPLEAMAAGCAVVSSLRGALAENCEGAVLAIDPGDVDSIAAGIDRVARDDALVESLRAKGAERVRRYDWRSAAERHREVYGRAMMRR